MLFFAGGVLGLLAVAFWLFGVFDALTAPADKVRAMQKPLWILVALIGLDLGAVLWFVFGRPRVGVPGLEQRDRRSDMWGGAFERPQRPSSRPGAKRPIAPDDDPEFLRSLNKPRPEDDVPPG